MSDQLAVSFPKPEDPMIKRMAKLRSIVDLSRGWKTEKLSFRQGQHVALPSSDSEAPHIGTVSKVESHQFRVTWPQERDRRGYLIPRQRLWYDNNLAELFTIVP